MLTESLKRLLQNLTPNLDREYVRCIYSENWHQSLNYRTSQSHPTQFWLRRLGRLRELKIVSADYDDSVIVMTLAIQRIS